MDEAAEPTWMPCEDFRVGIEREHGEVTLQLQLVRLYTKPPVYSRALLSPDQAERIAHELLRAAAALRQRGEVPGLH